MDLPCLVMLCDGVGSHLLHCVAVIVVVIVVEDVRTLHLFDDLAVRSIISISPSVFRDLSVCS